jgi:hypothetical protein
LIIVIMIVIVVRRNGRHDPGSIAAMMIVIRNDGRTLSWFFHGTDMARSGLRVIPARDDPTGRGANRWREPG